MKKIVSFIAAVAALGSVSTAFSQVKENKEVTHMGAGVVANQNTSYSPTVTQLGGNVVEYREYTPEFSLSLLGVSAAVGYESEYVFRGEKRSGHAIQPKVESALCVGLVCGCVVFFSDKGNERRRNVGTRCVRRRRVLL